MTPTPSLLERAIEQIVEISADVQIKRRRTMRNSLAFHDYSVTIAAYGETLEALTALLKQQEEYSASFGLLGSLGSTFDTHAIL